MKKVLLSLLAVAALVLSCQNYDDEFDALNAKVSSLESQISSLQGLQTALTALQGNVASLQSAVNAIPDPSSSIATLATSIAEILTELGALETAVAAASTSDELEILKGELEGQIAALEVLVQANSTELTSLGVDLSAVLGSVAAYEDNLTINDAASLAFAKSLGVKVKNIKGNLTIDVSGADITAAQVAEVSGLVESVIGNVSLTNDSSITESPIDVSNLTSIKGNYEVIGWDASDDNLASVTGTVTTNYGGAISFPALTSSGLFTITNVTAAAATATTKAVTAVTSVDLTSLTSGTITDAASASAGTLALPAATSVKIGDVSVVSLTANLALEVELHYDSTLAGLALNTEKATSIVVKASSITGAINVDQAATGSIEFVNATTFGNTSAFDGVSFKADKLKTITGAMTANVATSISLPAATLSSSTISATAATSFVANSLVAGGAISLKAGAAITIASAATADLGTLATLGSVTLTAQDETLDLSAGVALTSVSVTGKSNSSDITINEAATLLATLSFAGKNGNIVLGSDGTDGLEKLTTFSTTGTISSLSVYNAVALESINMAHTADATEGSKFVVTNNDKLTSFTTSFDHVYSFKVVGNGTLASFDASSITTIPLDADGDDDFEFTVEDNFTAGTTDTFANAKGLVGTYTPAAVTATTTTELAFGQSSLLTLAPYITKVLTATGTGKQLDGIAAINTAAVGTEGELTLKLDYQIAEATAGTAPTRELSSVYTGGIDSATDIAAIK